ncbi:Cytochrome p450 [Globisporangium polare]
MATKWLATAAGTSDWQQICATLAVLYLSSRVAAHLFARVTISDAEKNAPRVSHDPRARSHSCATRCRR